MGSREVKLKVSGGYISILSKLGTDENIKLNSAPAGYLHLASGNLTTIPMTSCLWSATMKGESNGTVCIKVFFVSHHCIFCVFEYIGIIDIYTSVSCQIFFTDNL